MVSGYKFSFAVQTPHCVTAISPVFTGRIKKNEEKTYLLSDFSRDQLKRQQQPHNPTLFDSTDLDI